MLLKSFINFQAFRKTFMFAFNLNEVLLGNMVLSSVALRVLFAH